MQAGRLCAIAEFSHGASAEAVNSIGKQTCQHIVGFTVDSSHPLVVIPQARPFNAQSMNEANSDLLKQPFLLDESKTVGEVLLDAGLQLGVFHRFMLGQES